MNKNLKNLKLGACSLVPRHLIKEVSHLDVGQGGGHTNIESQLDLDIGPHVRRASTNVYYHRASQPSAIIIFNKTY